MTAESRDEEYRGPRHVEHFPLDPLDAAALRDVAATGGQPALDRACYRLHRKGYAVLAIANVLGVSRERTRQRIARYAEDAQISQMDRQGLSDAQIAEELGIRVATVDSRIVRYRSVNPREADDDVEPAIPARVPAPAPALEPKVSHEVPAKLAAEMRKLAPTARLWRANSDPDSPATRASYRLDEIMLGLREQDPPVTFKAIGDALGYTHKAVSTRVARAELRRQERRKVPAGV